MEGVLYPGEFIVPTNDDNLAVENPNLKKEKITKRKVIKQMREKLEETKLSVIKEEFAEKNIAFPENITTIKDLEKKLKKTSSELDYNKAHSIIQSISDQFNATVNSLEEGSKTAFTKLMTSRTTTSIAKSLGVSLTGRTLLVLAPTALTKAIVAGGMGAYYVVNAIKNKKSVKAANISNEINNILLDLEATKIDDKYVDTRFNEECQETIKQFLNDNNIMYTYTGYRSLISAVYSMNDDLKLKLAKQLNIILARDEEIDTRLEKAGEKLNVVAATATAAGIGLSVGKEIANTINDINPAIGATAIATTGGSFLGDWLAKITGKSWLKKLTTGVATVGTAVLGFFGIGKGIMAIGNNVVFSTAGTIVGTAIGPVLSIISTIKDIIEKKKLNKKFKEYNKLDAEKYAEDDAKEFEVLKQKMTEEVSIEQVVLDITLGFIRDSGINLNGTPQSIKELNYLIDNLPQEDKDNAKNIEKYINDALLSDTELLKRNIKKAANVTGTLVLSGFSALSIYDLIKGGTFLPELSQKIFTNNNLNSKLLALQEASESLSKVGNLTDKEFEKICNGIYEEVKDTAVGVPESLTIFNKELIKMPWNGTYEFDFSVSETLNTMNDTTKLKLIKKLNEISYTEKHPFFHDLYSKDGGILRGRLFEYLGGDIDKMLNRVETITNVSSTLGTVSVPVLTTYETASTISSEYEKDNSQLKR